MSTSSHSPASPPPKSSLPLVVQVGFAGSRFLYDRKAHPIVDPVAFHEAVQNELTECLRTLPENLGLTPDRHFLCGLSALAIGADTHFARACQVLGWWQRILLPQPREDFLTAIASDGTPDFTKGEGMVARSLLESSHVIEERVVSGSQDRRTRFEDVNLELVRVSDVLVCLVCADAAGKSSVTQDVVKLAARHHRPLLEIQVRINEAGKPELNPKWHWNSRPKTDTASWLCRKPFQQVKAFCASMLRRKQPAQEPEKFQPPELAHVFHDLEWEGGVSRIPSGIARL